MAMSQLGMVKEFKVEALLHPANAFRTPMEVVNDPNLTVQEKRAILVAWASDACAMEASPELRQLASAEPVQFHDIMDALKCLDGETAAQPNYAKFAGRTSIAKMAGGASCLRLELPPIQHEGALL
jgi:hypothetical protein